MAATPTEAILCDESDTKVRMIACVNCSLVTEQGLFTECRHVICDSCEDTDTNCRACDKPLSDGHHLRIYFPIGTFDNSIVSCNEGACDWKGEMKDLPAHRCSFCAKCGMNISGQKIEEHPLVCPAENINCEFEEWCCEMFPRRERWTHFSENHYAAWLTEGEKQQAKIAELEKQCAHLQQMVATAAPTDSSSKRVRQPEKESARIPKKHKGKGSKK